MFKDILDRLIGKDNYKSSVEGVLIIVIAGLIAAKDYIADMPGEFTLIGLGGAVLMGLFKLGQKALPS